MKTSPVETCVMSVFVDNTKYCGAVAWRGSYFAFLIIACRGWKFNLWICRYESRSPSVDIYNAMIVVDTFRKQWLPTECIIMSWVVMIVTSSVVLIVTSWVVYQTELFFFHTKSIVFASNMRFSSVYLPLTTPHSPNPDPCFQATPTWTSASLEPWRSQPTPCVSPSSTKWVVAGRWCCPCTWGAWPASCLAASPSMATRVWLLYLNNYLAMY